MVVVRNGGQEKMHGVDKMDTDGNSQEGKTGNLQGRGTEVTKGRKCHGFGLGMI